MNKELFNGTPTENPSDDYNIAFGKIGFAGSWVMSVQKFIQWLSTKFVAIGSDQTITGQVTYATSPLVPDPTSPTGVVNLQTLLSTAGTDKNIITVSDHVSTAEIDKIYLINTTSKDIICSMPAYISGSKKETVFVISQGFNRVIIQNGGITYTLSNRGYVKLRGNGTNSWVLTEDSRNYTINQTISANTEIRLIDKCVFYVNTVENETITILLSNPTSGVLGISSEFVNKGLGTLEIKRTDSGAIDDTDTITIASKNQSVKIEENNGYYKTIYNTQQDASQVKYNDITVKQALDNVDANKIYCATVTELMTALEEDGDLTIKTTNNILIEDKTINLGTGTKTIESDYFIQFGGINVINNSSCVLISCNVKIANDSSISTDTGFPTLFCKDICNSSDMLVSKLTLSGRIDIRPSNTFGVAYICEREDNLILSNVYYQSNNVQLCMKGINSDTTVSSFIPVGYKIDSIVVKETSGNSTSLFVIQSSNGIRGTIGSISPGVDALSTYLIDGIGLVPPCYPANYNPFRTTTINPNIFIGAQAWNSAVVDILFNLKKIF